MRSYALLRELVRDCGGKLVEQHGQAKHDPLSYAVFEGRAHNRFRMCWDKKAKRGTLEVREADGTWRVREPVVRKIPGTPFCDLYGFLATAEHLAGRRED
jgi:hypothetical protein